MEDGFPKWVSRGYGLGEILCQNADEEKAVLSPLAADAGADESDDEAAAQAEELVHTIESLQAKLDAAGIEYDKRWGTKRLAALLPTE